MRQFRQRRSILEQLHQPPVFRAILVAQFAQDLFDGRPHIGILVAVPVTPGRDQFLDARFGRTVLGIAMLFGRLAGSQLGLAGNWMIAKQVQRFEIRPQPVEVLDADRIVLVVVALGAAELHRQQRAAHGGRHFVEHDVPPLLLQVDVGHVRPAEQKAGGHGRRRIAGLEQIAGQLQADELVVGQVAVQRVDHPVAIAPGIGSQQVVFESVRLGKPGQVEPMLGIALAVRRRRQQPVHQLLIRVWRIVAQECLDLFRRWRQTGQIKAHTAQQRGSACHRQGIDRLLVERTFDERIDRAVAPHRVGCFRRLDLGNRQVSPMRPFAVGNWNLLQRWRNIRRAGQYRGGAEHARHQPAGGEALPRHARISVTTWPATSVNRSSRPLCRYVSDSWSSPSRCRIVACRSWT